GPADPRLPAGAGARRDAARAAGRRRARTRHPHAGRAGDRVLRALTTFAPLFVPEALRDAVSDAAWLDAVLDAERALANASCPAGALSAEDAAAVAEQCDASLYDVDALSAEGRAAGNPVEPLVRALRGHVGAEHGASVHRGATSQDVLDTAAMLVARNA